MTEKQDENRCWYCREKKCIDDCKRLNHRRENNIRKKMKGGIKT